MRNYGITNAITFFLSWNKVVGTVSAHLSVLDRRLRSYLHMFSNLFQPWIEAFSVVFIIFFFYHVYNEQLWRVSETVCSLSRGPLSSPCAGILCVGVGGVFHFHPPPYFLIACILRKEKKNNTEVMKELKDSSSVKLIYSMEEWEGGEIMTSLVEHRSPWSSSHWLPGRRRFFYWWKTPLFAISTLAVYTINYPKWVGEESGALPRTHPVLVAILYFARFSAAQTTGGRIRCRRVSH